MGPLLIALAGFARADEPALMLEIHASQERIEQLRGLAFTADVPVQTQTEDELRASIRASLDAQLTPAVAHGMEQALRAFGLVQPGFDVRASFTEILTEQVAGYYAPRSRELFVVQHPDDAAISSPLGEAMVTEHELVHALQDQHFDLWQLTEREYFDDDVSIAVRTLVEGDATWVMMADTVSALGIDPDEADLGAFVQQLGDPVQTGGPMLAAAPAVLTRGLVLPYSEGPGLVDKLRRIGGWDAVNGAFATPPLSTEQVLHPERYLSSTPDWPTGLHLPPLAPKGWTQVYENTMGELQIRVLLEQYASDVAVKAADGWDGDRYAILERGGTPAIVWLTTWDSPRDAAEFATAAERFAATLYAPGRWRVDTHDQDVVVVCGLKPKLAAAAAAAVEAGTTRAEQRVPDDVAPRMGPRPGE